MVNNLHGNLSQVAQGMQNLVFARLKFFTAFFKFFSQFVSIPPPYNVPKELAFGGEVPRFHFFFHYFSHIFRE